MNDEINSGSLSIISLPDKLAHAYITRSCPLPESPKSAPTALELHHQQSMFFSVATSIISLEGDQIPPTDTGATLEGESISSPLKKSQYPKCVSTSYRIEGDDGASTQSPLSTLTPEPQQLLKQRTKDAQHNEKAIDLALRFLHGIHLPKTAPSAGADDVAKISRRLLPGICHQKFDDFSHWTPITGSSTSHKKVYRHRQHIPYLPMRPRTIPSYRQQLLLSTKAAHSTSDLHLQLQDKASSRIQAVDDIDFSLQEVPVNEDLRDQIEVGLSSSFAIADADKLGGISDERGIPDEDGNYDDDDDNSDDDTYSSFEQGEEHTLGDYEDQVASMLGDDQSDDTFSEQASSSTTTGGDASSEDNWPDNVVQPELPDPTGLLSAMDRILDCFDPPRVVQSGEWRVAATTPEAYHEHSLLDYGDHLEWEAAMERDGMDWLFPCCDDSGLDREFEHFLDDSSTEGDRAPDDQESHYRRRRCGQWSTSVIEKKGNELGLDDEAVLPKDKLTDGTMMTESDSSLELSIRS